jgi:hydroxymethylglutaryl-CoA lyase
MFPSPVQIVEVGPRDGFQMESQFIPTVLKVEVIDQLARAGLQKIESTSFVSPKVIPQMADAETVLAHIGRLPEVCYTALVPNVKGAHRAINAKASSVRMVVCVSETYNRKNVGLSVQQSVENCREVMSLSRSANIGCEVIIALAFGCPLEGEIGEDAVIRLAGELGELGYTEIGIADSIGVASPRQVTQLMSRLRRSYPQVHFSAHFHNTRGLGLVNVLGALEAGIDAFDSSLGGLGGCPVVPGATGNIATEDLVNCLEEMGISTGVSIAGVIAATKKMEAFLGRSLESYVANAGTRKELFARAANISG